MSIKQKITDIITTRQSVKDEFIGYDAKVKEMSSFIRNVKKVSNSNGWQQLLSQNDKLKEEWSNFFKYVTSLEELITKLQADENTGLLVECMKRVHRDYLNIGCVGPWRQGKSTVIAELSNLDDYVIPRSKFEACTGTTINVFNGEEEVWDGTTFIKKGGDKATIFFYSFKEMCNLINEYLSQLGFRTMSITQNADVLRSQCTELKKRYENQSVDNGQTETKKMLMAYLGNVDEYVEYLRTNEGEYRTIENLSKLESRQELRPFVSYYEHPDAWYEEQNIDCPQRVHRVLAVKNVNVYTSFEICGEDVGKIQFLDTPGIGESKIGVNESLAKALRQDLDIAICLKKIHKGVTNTESYEFHKLLRANVDGRHPENWIFYLFNVCEDKATNALVNATITPLLKDLSSTVLQNGEQGISLRNNDPEDPASPNHIATLNVMAENNALQQFFHKILVEMSNTILTTDESFYSEARKAYNAATAIYTGKIIKGLLEVTRSIPTFDDRETIQNIINEVKHAWDHALDNGKNDFKLDRSIQEALKGFYNEPVGCQFAKSFLNGYEPQYNITEKQIEDFKRDLMRCQEQEMSTTERNAIKEQKRRELIYPSVEYNITPIMFSTTTYPQVLPQWTEDLEKHVLETTINLIDDKNVIQKMSDIKAVFWKALRTKGRLGFISANEDTWFEEFLSLLKDGGADFKDLYDCLYEFNNQKIDLREQIITIIKNTTGKIIREYTDYGSSPDFNSVEGIRNAYFTCLINKENKIKFMLKTKFEDTVGGQVQKAEETFANNIANFIKTIIPADRHITEYLKIYEQLIKFYHKYAAVIFTNDEQKEQKIAVNEWNVFVRKYI